MQLAVDPILLAVKSVLFLAGCFLSWKMLLKPLTGLLDARQTRIRSDLDAAQLARQEADRLAVEQAAQLRETQQRAVEILANAERRAHNRAAELEAEARERMAQEEHQARLALEADRLAAAATLRAELATLASAMAGAILGREVDEATHRALLQELIAELAAAEPSARNTGQD